ncbi:helix-turn-helix domain-containing protein [Brevibacillus sp. 179-C9.3 HS]|uniref:helix-turn-helix domain-containing protein n=1 Tax=unclassified Brevibacillus TaxID=2684853 RepID=UPI0039A39E79
MEVTEGISYTTLGELINKHREQAGLTQSELARNAGLSKTAISMIERGEIKLPEFMTIKKIADVLGIEKAELIEHYVEFEKRPDILQEMLLEAAELSNLQLVTKIAEKFLESPRQDTETALKRLNDLSSTIADTTIKLSLYKTIVTYSRQRGVQRYLAKGLLQQYLIERMDLKTLEESFKVGEEILHYTLFLNHDEKLTFYYRMALHAHNTKKYKQCIELCEAGLAIDTSETELKARAHLALIISLSNLNEYDKVEKNLELFKNYSYEFVWEAAMLESAIVKSKQKDYDNAIPMLNKCLEEISAHSRIHVVNELIEIYLMKGDTEAIAELINREEEILPANPTTPYKHLSIGRYFQYKGAFQLKVGFIDDGIDSFTRSLLVYGKINAYEEITKCMKEFLSNCSVYPNYSSVINRLKQVFNSIDVENY